MTFTQQNAPGTNEDHFQSHYIPSTTEEQAEMLATLGLDSIDQLFTDIADEFRNPTLDLPAPLSELDIQRELGERNADGPGWARSDPGPPDVGESRSPCGDQTRSRDSVGAAAA